MLTYYCWSCRAELAGPVARCRSCGGPAPAPAGAGYRDRLVWALEHPVVERRTVALDALARLRERAAWDAVRRLLDYPYLAAAALRTLVAIDPAAAGPLVEHHARGGHAVLRRAALGVQGGWR